MSKEMQNSEKVIDEVAKQVEQNIFALDELSLSYVAGGEAVVFS
jgi:hypothetical protein